MNDGRKDLVELQRSRFQDEIDEVCEILNTKKIPYKLGSDGAIFDLSQVGVGGDPQTIISVPAYLFSEAREAMEEFFITTPLPEDHYLHEFSEEELTNLLGSQDDWSPYDVAHAKRMMSEKGITSDQVEASKKEHQGSIADGKLAPKWMIWLPFLLTLLWVCMLAMSGFLGVMIPFMSLGVSWSVVTMKAKHPYSQYFLYDLKSREAAKIVLYINMVFTAVGLILLFSII